MSENETYRILGPDEVVQDGDFAMLECYPSDWRHVWVRVFAHDSVVGKRVADCPKYRFRRPMS